MTAENTFGGWDDDDWYDPWDEPDDDPVDADHPQPADAPSLFDADCAADDVPTINVNTRGLV